MESIKTQSCEFVDRGGGFVQRELDRIAAALRGSTKPEDYAQLYAAQQALSWALEPNGFASPFDALTASGSQEAQADCSGEDRPPSF